MKRPLLDVLGAVVQGAVVLGAVVFAGCSSTSPEAQATVVRSTQDLSLRMAEAPGWLRNELGRLGDATRSFELLFVPEPAKVRLVTSPLVSRAIADEPRRLEHAQRTAVLLSDFQHFGPMHENVTALASPRAGTTSLSLAIELQRTSDACRSFTTLLRLSQSALRRVDLTATWPDSPLQEWLSILLK